MQGPEARLAKLGVTIPGAIDPRAPAVLAPDHRLVVNGQFYWASNPEQAEVMRASPHLYVGPVRDPVSRAWFSPTDASPRRDADGQVLYFESAESVAAFDRDPASFPSIPSFPTIPRKDP